MVIIVCGNTYYHQRELKNITEENLQNRAYQLLMEVYIEDPDEEQYDLLSHLFREWCESGRPNLLHHMFEIIESHESMKVRELVLNHLKESYPENQKNDILELWITHPLPIMKEFVTEIVETKQLELPVRSAVYVMLDDIPSLMDIDPDFHHLDNYLKTVDPLLGSLLIQKVEQLKNPELNVDFLPEEDEGQKISLIDRIRKRDFSYLWENILDYPLPFIAELLRIFHEEEWAPVDTSSSDLYEILIEEIGVKGWFAIEQTKWVVVSKKEYGSYTPLSRADIDRGDFQLRLSQDLVVRPDRITSQKFLSRGRFNLSNPQLGLNIYMEGVRKSDFDGLLHVPIYAANGVELAEFNIPVSSEKNFAMDEDGLYFTIKNKQGTYSVDLDALAAFLLPISRHSEMINDMVPVLLERANEDQKMPIRALNLLSTMHRGREFSLWDLKMVEDWEDDSRDTLKADSCLCTIAIDLGNATTKVSQVVKGSCEHEPRNWEFPTVIYYRSPEDFIVGQEVIDNGLRDTSQTYQNIKASLQHGARRHLRIQNSTVSAYDAYRDYLFSIIDQVSSDLDFDPLSLALTFPLHAPSGFEAWLRTILQERGYTRIELIDELSASVLGSYRLQNQRGNVVMIDIGSSQMGVSVTAMTGNKSRKRLEEARMREDFDDSPEIIAKISIDQGSLELSELMFEEIKNTNLEFHGVFHLLEETKKEVSEKFVADLNIEDNTYKFSMNDDGGINMDHIFNQSDLFYAFKILLRNVMVKANLRGLAKEDLETVLIQGSGSMWPGFLEYINRIFPDQEVIIEDDTHLTSKGVGLLANGQSIRMKLEEDLLLKVAKNGIVAYETVASRGENLLGKTKQFEIRPYQRMDKLVLDCWVRRPVFIADENVQPMKDNQNLGHGHDTRKLFHYDRLFREIIDLDGDSILMVNISTRGTLYFGIQSDTSSQLVTTDSSVY